MANDSNNNINNHPLLNLADSEEEVNRVAAVEYVNRMIEESEDLSGAAMILSRFATALIKKQYMGKLFEVWEAATAAGYMYRKRPCSGHFNTVATNIERRAKKAMEEKLGTWDKRTRKYVLPRVPGSSVRTKRASTDPILQTEVEALKGDDVPPQPLSPSTISTAPRTPTPTPAPVNTEDVDSKPVSPSIILAAPGTPASAQAPLKTPGSDNKPSHAITTPGSVVQSPTPSSSDVAANKASLTLTVVRTDRFSIGNCAGGTPVPKDSTPKMTQGAPLAEVCDWEALYAQHASARDIHLVSFSVNKHLCSRNRRRSRTNRKLCFRPLSPATAVKPPSDYKWLQHANGYAMTNLFSDRVVREEDTRDYAWLLDAEDVSLWAMFEEVEVQVEEAPVPVDVGEVENQEGTTTWLEHLWAPVRWFQSAFGFVWRAIVRVF